MIIISSSIVLGGGDPPLSFPVIGWQNLVTPTNIEATTEDVDYPATNLANPNTSLLWKGTGADSPAAEEYLTVTLSGTDEVDYLALARHNFGTTQATISVEGLEGIDSPSAWFELVDEYIPADDSPLLLRFTRTPLNAVRLRIQVGSAIPYASVLYVGALLLMERGVQGDYTPLPFARQTTVVTGETESGNYVGRIVTGGRVQSTPRFIGLDQDWMRENLDPFLEQAIDNPFFFAWSPEDRPYEVGFATLTSDAIPVLSLEGYASIDLPMTGIML